jgi:outer membrane protein assembly factor BamE (lipoprotein component of BamABCDE complex)
MRLLTLFSLLAVLLVGCGTAGGLGAQQSTRDDVRASLGQPAEVRKDANGDELWEYARGPEGFHTHLVRIGADGKVKDVSQLVTEERLMRVVPGQTTKQGVRDLLGRPSNQMMTRVGETWSWRYQLNGQAGFLVVVFGPNDVARERYTMIDPYNSDSQT